MQSWTDFVSEVQRTLRLPPGKFKVKKTKGGEIVSIDVTSEYLLDARWSKGLFALKTPDNRSVSEVVIDLEDCNLSVLCGDVQMQTFNDKMKDTQINLESGVSRDAIEDLLEMSLVHPVIAELKVDEETSDDIATVTSSGPLMYRIRKDDAQVPVQFSFGALTASMEVRMPRAKRRRTIQSE